MAAPKPYRSGTRVTEATLRARGIAQLKVRVPLEYVRRLDELCAESGMSRPEQLMALIDAERAELDRLL